MTQHDSYAHFSHTRHCATPNTRGSALPGFLLALLLSVLVSACDNSSNVNGDAAVGNTSSSTSSDTSTAAGSTPAAPQVADASEAQFTVFKSPTCGCCEAWITHLEAAGFSSAIVHPEDMDLIKREQGIGHAFQSCHTAVSAEGYVFEGHVPAKFIRQFLQDPPANARGLAVPGMPLGSPGMEMGERFSPYKIVLLNNDGSSAVYAELNRAEDQFE